MLDRGYVDFDHLYKIHKKDACFVTRAKSNNRVKRIYSAKADKDQGILHDQQIKLEGPSLLNLIQRSSEESNSMMLSRSEPLSL